MNIQNFYPYMEVIDNKAMPDLYVSNTDVATVLNSIVGFNNKNSDLYNILDVKKGTSQYDAIYNMVSLGVMNLENIEIASGENSIKDIVDSVYSNSNISKEGNTKLECFVNALSNSLDYASDVDSNWKNLIEDNYHNNKSYNDLTVRMFCTILSAGGYSIDSEDVYSELSIDKDGESGSILGNFKPYDKITRAELAESIYTILSDNKNSYDYDFFSDINDLDPKQRTAINYLKEIGVISGKSGDLFSPHDFVTRAELVSIIDKAFGDYMISNPISSDIPEDIKGHWCENSFVEALIQ